MTDLGPLFAPSGADLKREGLERVEAAEPDAWKERAAAAIAEFAASGREFNAEDLRAAVGSPSRPNAMGAAFNRAAKAGQIVYVRHAPSSRPSLHRCHIRVWRGK